MVAAQRLQPLAYLTDRVRQYADRWEHEAPDALPGHT
jgi:hypothetical protein